MAGATDALEADILKLLTHQTASILPLSAGPYLALFTSAPTDSSGGTEVSGGAYARVDTSGKWAAPSGTTSVANNAALTFPAPSGADWGTVVAWGLLTASTSGTLLYYGTQTSTTILNGDQAPAVAIGGITITCD